ncbi:hypothetical protein ACFWNF_31880 [Streptomyces anulatus]|uniref:hypothetical protein n=1 Tax=Streptomyces anulatus TaxID=1892 RepID=UPI0036606665
MEPVPGLRVYELPAGHREEGDGAANPWRLEVADLADWTRPAEDLRMNGDLDLDEYVDRIETRVNGLLITPQTEPAR